MPATGKSWFQTNIKTGTKKYSGTWFLPSDRENIRALMVPADPILAIVFESLNWRLVWNRCVKWGCNKLAVLKVCNTKMCRWHLREINPKEVGYIVAKIMGKLLRSSNVRHAEACRHRSSMAIHVRTMISRPTAYENVSHLTLYGARMVYEPVKFFVQIKWVSNGQGESHDDNYSSIHRRVYC